MRLQRKVEKIGSFALQYTVKYHRTVFYKLAYIFVEYEKKKLNCVSYYL